MTNHIRPPYPQITSTNTATTTENYYDDVNKAGLLVLEYLKHPSSNLNDSIISFYNENIDQVSKKLKNEIAYYKYFNVHVKNFGVYAQMLYTKALVCYNYNLFNDFLGFDRTLTALLTFDHGKGSKNCKVINSQIEQFRNTPFYPKLLALPLERIIVGCIKYGKCLNGTGTHQLTGDDIKGFIQNRNLYYIFMRFLKSDILKNQLTDTFNLSIEYANAFQNFLNTTSPDEKEDFDFYTDEIIFPQEIGGIKNGAVSSNNGKVKIVKEITN